MNDDRLHVTAGPTVRADGLRLHATSEAFDAVVRAAEARQEHVWIMTGAWKLSDAAVKKVAAGEPDVLLDLENLVTLAPGCYICEEPLTPRQLHRRCRGNPPGGPTA